MADPPTPPESSKVIFWLVDVIFEQPFTGKYYFVTILKLVFFPIPNQPDINIIFKFGSEFKMKINTGKGVPKKYPIVIFNLAYSYSFKL